MSGVRDVESGVRRCEVVNSIMKLKMNIKDRMKGWKAT